MSLEPSASGNVSAKRKYGWADDLLKFSSMPLGMVSPVAKYFSYYTYVFYSSTILLKFPNVSSFSYLFLVPLGTYRVAISSFLK